MTSKETHLDRERNDLHLEIAGLDVGRIKRFLSEDARQYIQNQKDGSKKRDRLTMLDILLLTDPTFAQMYVEAMERIETIEHAVDRCLSDMHQNLSAMEERRETMRTHAYIAEDGTRYYRGNNDIAVRENGVVLSARESANIQWLDYHTRWPDYERNEQAIDTVKSGIDRVEHYRDTTLRNARIRMTDKENSIDKSVVTDTMEAIEIDLPDEVKLYLPDISSKQEHSSSFMQQFQDSVSGADKPDDVPITDIPDFTQPPAALGFSKPS